ncbi:putative folate-biopterin transporter 9, chloroplastic [Apostasia shenzhenica]|uniref:Putative folate-biopterin transporter 9, chloroplastic n=1 Tax=Apostasia shenzhenica TaxID=1088818 RepID=A0A2I0BF83_9ASPA|nr:putative folate-biopterin transporter 9, chloroplastic [Apostasia shenzhenica]
MICLSKPITHFTPFTARKPIKCFLPSHLHPPNGPNPSSSNEERYHTHLCETHSLKPFVPPSQMPDPGLFSSKKSGDGGEGRGSRIWASCGFGFWVQGFRCFPWLALNFHMAHGLGLSPSALQLVQNAGNLPMVAKPLFGLISDAVYIAGAQRLPYISIGAFLQALSWGTLALIPTHIGTFSVQMTCILLSNTGASITEVANDALVAVFGKTQKASGLQSYAFTALAAGALLGNMLGGFFLLKFSEPKTMFFIFSILLSIQLVFSLKTKEESLLEGKETSLYRPKVSNHRQNSLKENLVRQFNDLITIISDKKILYPLLWIVASNAVVPLFSGSIFCFQTECLKLDPLVIGLSKVVGQLMVLFITLAFNLYLKNIPMRKLVFWLQISYALSFLSDLILVKQYNVRLGLPNGAYVLCLSSLAESIAQFKTLPFTILFSRLCPSGSESSLFAFFASALCLSSILSGILGVGLASFLGVSSGEYSGLHLGIMVQSLAALLPLSWISYVPTRRNLEMKKA